MAMQLRERTTLVRDRALQLREQALQHYREHAADTAARAAAESAEAQQPIGELTGRLVEQMRRLALDELELAQLTSRRRLKRAGLGAGLLAASGFMAFVAFACAIAAVIIALDNVMRPWAAAITVAVAALIIAGLIGLPGLILLRRRKAVLADVSTRLRADVQALKEGWHQSAHNGRHPTSDQLGR